jgi:hypothetical protein
MCSKSSVKLDLGSIGHLVEGGNKVVVKGKKLSISRSESRVIHIPERNDLLNQQVNNINLVVGGGFEL